MVVDSCESSSETKEDGFEHILNDNLVLDGGDEDMSPNDEIATNSLSDSITGFKNGVPPSGSPTISSLLSRRVVLSNTNSSALNLLISGPESQRRKPQILSSYTLHKETLTVDIVNISRQI